LHEYTSELEWRWRKAGRCKQKAGGWGQRELEGDRDGAGHRQKGERDEKGKKGGHTMTSPPSYAATSWSSVALL